LSATEFASPTVPYAATDSQVTTLIRKHKTETHLFKEYMATGNALNQQVITAVNSMYLKTLRNRITGFATATTLEMLTHLYTLYDRLTPADLQDNHTCTNACQTTYTHPLMNARPCILAHSLLLLLLTV
jgi:ribosomal protein S17E